MNTEEARLRAMIDPAAEAGWDFDAIDRAAVRWALDAIERLKEERDEIRKELSHERHEAYRRRQAIRAALEKLETACETL